MIGLASSHFLGKEILLKLRCQSRPYYLRLEKETRAQAQLEEGPLLSFIAVRVCPLLPSFPNHSQEQSINPQTGFFITYTQKQENDTIAPGSVNKLHT